MKDFKEINGNIYAYFRGVNEITNELLFKKRFDEPTYLSFRTFLGSDSDYNYTGFTVSNDVMPHPLFMYNDNTVSTEDIEHYSAIRYLIDANEPGRAKMLFDFINGVKEMQSNYPYYFQSIDGIGELLKVDPTKGQRIIDKKITITCLEGLDQRMTYLMNLYRKAVWDDVYQRWVLPDMMRYFNVDIYLTEFRTFHGPSAKVVSIPTGPGTTDTRQIIDQWGNEYVESSWSPPLTPPREEKALNLSILDDILPIWHLRCEMCEFDITDITYEHLNGLNLGGDPVQGAVKIGIKVGNIKELQMYPLFAYMLDDKKLSGLGRLKLTEDEDITAPRPIDFVLSKIETRIAQSNPNNGAETDHVSGLQYNTDRNSTTVIQNAVYPGKDADSGDRSKATNMVGKGEINTNTVFYDDKSGQVRDLPVDSTNPNTWVGNALDFGTNYAVNFAKKIIDKAKMTPIPGLGASAVDIISAIQSKDIVTAFGTIRKAVTVAANEYVYPSMRLEGPLYSTDDPLTSEEEKLQSSTASANLGVKIVDNLMAQVILEMTKSDATDDLSVQLQQAANMVLNDRGLWEQIKDYSLATDMLGPQESNMQNDLQDGAYKRVQDSEIDRLGGEATPGMSQTIKASAILYGDAGEGGTIRNVQPSAGLSGQVNKDQKTINILSEATNLNEWQSTKELANPDISKATRSALEAENTLTVRPLNKKIEVGEIIEAAPTSLATKGKLDVKKLETVDPFRANEGKLTQEHFESNPQVDKVISVERLKSVDPFEATKGSLTGPQKQIYESRATTTKLETENLQNEKASRATNSKLEVSNLDDTVVPSTATNSDLISK